MKRHEIINRLIVAHRHQSYLEIGIDNAALNYDLVMCESKTGVDPNPGPGVTHEMTSSRFFSRNTATFDIIFIDGLHFMEQVYADIQDALLVLRSGGTIVCHDLLPTTEEMQRREPQTGAWTGDCWKAWIHLRQDRNDLLMYVVDADYGCGIIQRGEQRVLPAVPAELWNYAGFEQNKQDWMNIVTVEEFLFLTRPENVGGVPEG